MWRALSWLSKNLLIVIPTVMVFGFAYGLMRPAGNLKGLIVPLTFLMVYPMMVTLKIKQVFRGGDGRAQWMTQALNFGVIPFLAYGVGFWFFDKQPAMALGLLLAGLVPTSGMTISWTGFAKGNMTAAVKMTVIGLILGSLATPFYVGWLMGAQIQINLGMVAKQIVLIVFLPMTLGFVTQRFLVRRYGQELFQKEIGPKFPPMATLGVLGIVFVALALKAETIAAQPQLLLQILFPLILLYSANYLISTLIGRTFLPRGDAIALVYGSVMRNLSIALAIAINAFGESGTDAALVVALAYIVQVQSAAWYVRGSERWFGPQPSLAKS